MTKIRFSFSINKEKLESELEKVDSLNNIMATDKYHIEIESETKVTKDEEGQKVEINLNPKCTE